MFKQVPTNDCVIEITPRYAGDYGFMVLSGEKRSAKDEYRVCEEIVDDVRRHVDNVARVYINQVHVYQDDDENTYETLYDALDAQFEFESYGYRYRYHHPSDQCGTSGRAYSFSELVETAYTKPWAFEVVEEYTPLSESQREGLDKVVAAGLEARK